MAEALSAQAVTAGYNGRQVLRDLSFSLAEGAFAALIGPNGSGKTSVLRLFTGGINVTAGSVRIFGADAQRMPDAMRGRTLAVLSQERVPPVPFTVREVVELGRLPHLGASARLKPADDEAVKLALAELQLEEFARRRFNELSGGERQMVLLARALAQQPRVLLLDEPTTHLDLAHQKRLLDSLARLRAERGFTVLVSLHNLSLAGSYAERLLLLDSGELVADGPPAEVLVLDRLEQTYRTHLVLLKGANGAPVITIEPEHRNEANQNR